MGFRLTRLGSEFESVIAAVLGFILMGVLIFFACFIITKLYLCFKYNKKRRERNGGGKEDEDFSYTIITEGEYDSAEFPA